MEKTAISLLEFNRRVNRLLHDTSVQQCWVVAETSDVMVRNGHCYLELVQKNPDTGITEAKARAIIWANRFASLRYAFETTTGQTFGNGLKVMVEASANFHEQFGFSLLITNINPSYTLGDMARQRLEIINRLKREGIINMNKELCWTAVPQRIAVISAGSAAGYGDFMGQLHNNPSGIQFYTCLFQAAMQGANTVPSIIAALNRINENIDLFDCVVIIRGGGATSELNAFDNYELAANIAQFPIPVITGIGHDRDNTVVDTVANVRVKTPTAAAEWLLSKAQQALDSLNSISDMILALATQMTNDARQQLSYFTSSIPLIVQHTLTVQRTILHNYLNTIPMHAAGKIEVAKKDLAYISQNIASAVRQRMLNEGTKLDNLAKQADLLSPLQVLKRGYSLTMKNGKTVANAESLKPGDFIETIFATDKICSEIKEINK